VTDTPWLPAVRSLANDVGLAARGRRASLAAVTVSIPPFVDPRSFAMHLAARLAGMGMPDVEISTHSGPGPAALISIEFHR